MRGRRRCLSGNAAGSGASGSAETGGEGGGLYEGAGSATLSRDTLSDNTSGAGGSGPFVDPGGAFGAPGGDGGGIYSRAALHVTDSTLSGNLTGPGGANTPPHIGSAPPRIGGGIALSFVTIADNADGIVDLAGTITLGGTIVADNAGPSCTGPVAETTGFNLDSGTSCGFTAAGDLTSTEPLLGALGADGGPTATQALLAGSPAIDHGGTAGCPAVDQRGRPRPDEAADGGACDIGAYESRGLG